MKIMLVLALVLAGGAHLACGSCDEKAAGAPDRLEAASAETVGGGAAVARSAVAEEDTEAGDLAGRRRILEALAAMEVSGFERERGEVRGDLVTLRFARVGPDARGQRGTVEATIGFCDGCPEVSTADLEAQRETLLAQLGELHARNPELVLEIEDLELAPARVGASTFVRSYVDDGTTRAAILTLDVRYVDGGASLRLQAHPSSGFPGSAAEHLESISKAELGALVRAIFEAASSILWPLERP